MIIPKLSAVEFLIEEGRLPGLVLSFAALIGICALVLALFLYPEVRMSIVGNLTTLVEVSAGVGGIISGFKTWVKHQNGNGGSAPPTA